LIAAVLDRDAQTFESHMVTDVCYVTLRDERAAAGALLGC
jgi:hypothetical protein